MTLAAEELGVTHGAISRALKGLEQDLACRLVERSHGQAILTPVGRRLAATAAKAFDEIAAALDAERSDQEVLRVSCISSFAARWLIPRLWKFKALHPGIEIQVHEAGQLTRLPERGFDAAIRMIDDQTDDGRTSQTLFESYHGPVHGRASLVEASLDALASLPRLVTRTYEPAWTDWQRDAGVDWGEARTVHEFDRYLYTLEAALSGLGIAIAPWPIVVDQVREGRLIAPRGFVKSRARFVLYVRQGIPGPALADFQQWISAEAQALVPPPQS